MSNISTITTVLGVMRNGASWNWMCIGAGDSTEAIVTMLLAPYEYPGALVSYKCFPDIRYATMLSGNGVKTVRCSYDELHEPLRLTMLRETGPWSPVGSFLCCSPQ